MALVIDLCQEPKPPSTEALGGAATLHHALAQPPRKRRRQSLPAGAAKVICLDLSLDTTSEDESGQRPEQADASLPDCPICLDEIPASDRFTSSCCGHSLHFICARATVLDAIKSGTVPILCPACLAGEADCRACAKRKSSGSEPHEWCCSLDADLNLLLTCEEMETYHQRVCPAAALRSQELKPCPQTDCTGLAVTQPGVPKLVCCACEHEWCGSCKVPWHEGRSCEQVKQEASAAPADAAFATYMKETRTVVCPDCSRALQKKEGCNRIRCLCGTQLCWLCGTKLDKHNPYSHYALQGPCYTRIHT